MLKRKYYLSSVLGLSLFILSPLASAMPGSPYQHGHESMHHQHYHAHTEFGWFQKPWFYRHPSRVIVVNPGYPSPNIVIIRR